MKIVEIEAKSIFTRSKLPGVDFVVNPYIGCQFGCRYCYATFMSRFVNEPAGQWGEYVYVKRNAVSLATKELHSWSAKKRLSSVLLSSATDPYQGPEARYQLTRGVLTLLAQEAYPGAVSVLTKSPLVLRDLDLLQSLGNREVGMTITTLDQQLGRLLEYRAPATERRLATLAELHRHGIASYAFVGPILPYYADQPAALEQLFAQISETGVREVYVDYLNQAPRLLDQLRYHVRSTPAAPLISTRYPGHLEQLIREALAKHSLRLRSEHLFKRY